MNLTIEPSADRSVGCLASQSIHGEMLVQSVGNLRNLEGQEGEDHVGTWLRSWIVH